MRRIWIAGICLAGILVFTAGCNNNSGTVDTSAGAPRQAPPFTQLIAQGRPPVPDLPVPLGFKLDEGRSRDYSVAGARFVDHLYKGRADKFAIKRFYERQMPINRWVLSTAMFAGGDVMLDFEKDTERCRVTVTSGGLLRRKRIKVRLWTSGPIQSPTQK